MTSLMEEPEKSSDSLCLLTVPSFCGSSLPCLPEESSSLENVLWVVLMGEGVISLMGKKEGQGMADLAMC